MFTDDEDDDIKSIYEVTSAKCRIQHKEPIIVGFFILQYAKLRMLELYYNFLDRFCDNSMFEEIEMDTDSLYMAIGGDGIDALITDPRKKEEWQTIRSNDCREDFEADATNNFFPRVCCDKHKKFDKRTPGLFKEEFRGDQMIALCSKTYCIKNFKTESSGEVVKFSSKGLNKRQLLNDKEEEPMKKFKRVMDTKENIESENRGFRVKDHGVFTYVQQKKGLAYFYCKRKVDEDGINTTTLDL